MKQPIPLVKWILVIFVIISFGISGFMIIEDYSFFDALYMVTITITTIGYHEVHPLSSAGKAFNILLILTSFSTFTYALAHLTQYVASGEMTAYFKNRNLMQVLEKMENHVVICGFGRNGQQAAKILRSHKINFVVIDKQVDLFNSSKNEHPNLVYLAEDATNDDTLIRAGIKKARALLVTLPTDSDNVFIVLSARSLNSDLQIISRATNQSASVKLYKAGASNVIMPDTIGGTHMATLVSKPDVLEFIDFLSSEDGESIHIESISFDNLPQNLKGKTIFEIMNWKKTGVNCIGIKSSSGKFFINPPGTTCISEGMRIIFLGTLTQIAEMKDNLQS